MLGLTNTTNVTLVLSQSTEGLEPEELENFGKAWAEAVSLCLERRMMVGGHSLEEVMEGLAEEVGLDKFSDIVDHFLGSITVEKIENEDTPEDDEGRDDMY